MSVGDLDNSIRKTIEEVIGYLNFSSGAADPLFAAGMNKLFENFEGPDPGHAQNHNLDKSPGDTPSWRRVHRLLLDGLEYLHANSKAFEQIDQAQSVLALVFEEFLPAYLNHHRDLLFHQHDTTLFRPFFIARVAETVLHEGRPWEETNRIVSATMRHLNDFVGHRPLAVLEGDRRLQTYDHERVRPIPLWIKGAGAAVGPYHNLLELTLKVIAETDPVLLRQACFDMDQLDELAVDPRAYDFDHPVNKRPNYHFGQWDPHIIDGRGYYRRFVLQQVTLDGILDRLSNPGRLSRKNVLHEAAAVLAGTILMGSGISGDCPEAHDSHTSLLTLLPQIAAYRDDFYEQFMNRLSGKQSQRLRSEEKRLHQPFGAARQHLNQWLAGRRAMQLQHVHLAQLFARMGYAEAAARQAHIVPVASARMQCEICCRLTESNQLIDEGRLEAASKLLGEIEDLLHRGIECGAFIDPWNILGFGAQFSLFPALENSVHDHRADELIDLAEEIFALYARLEKEAAAAGQSDLKGRLSENLEILADWWDHFATTEVSSVNGFSGRQAWESAEHVAVALGAWSEGGTAAGDIAFWRGHVGKFTSPKAYALVIEALLGHGDPVASMALLMQWLSQADQIPLAEGGYIFHDMAMGWMEELCELPGTRNAQKKTAAKEENNTAASPENIVAGAGADTEENRGLSLAERWAYAHKFMDYIEAGGEGLNEVPRLEILSAGPTDSQGNDLEGDLEGDEEDAGLFGAAYENVVYRDSTDDGFDGEISDGGGPSFGSEEDTDFELLEEAERISERLEFISMLAQLWKLTAGLDREVFDAEKSLANSPDLADSNSNRRERLDTLQGGVSRLEDFHRDLLVLLESVNRYHIAPPSTLSDSLAEFDRRQGIKSMLLDRIIDTTVEVGDAQSFVISVSGLPLPEDISREWLEPGGRILQAVFNADVESIKDLWPEFVDILEDETLLYMPISRGGKPDCIVASRALGQILRRLLVALPKLGMLLEAFELIATIQIMEREHPVGPGGITEFDRMFEIGFKEIINAIVSASKTKRKSPSAKTRATKADIELVNSLEQAAEPLLYRWLGHSRNIRLSVLETVNSPQHWAPFKQFIEEYGHDLFSQSYMGYGNLRAILHQGIGAYLDWLSELPDADEEHRLVADLDGRLPREKAIHWMGIIIESVVENYTAYMDYNSTTTQSDRGEMLYTLLDFMRLTTSYDRVAWNLRPLFSAHETLVERGRDGAAGLWREAVAERTAEIADEHLDRLTQLIKHHGMQLPSVADRLSERFIRPLIVDRLRSLVAPAVKERLAGGKTQSFDLLEDEIGKLTAVPSGVGFEIPSWLDALEEEAARVSSAGPEEDDILHPYPALPEIRLTLKAAQRQIRDWDGGYE